MHIERAPHEQERLEENGGRDQIAQAQCSKEHFAKGADIEHPPSVIQPLQSLQRAPTKAVFAIIVVLQNPCISLSSPVQQNHPARKAHGHSRGELMRGGGGDQARLWTPLSSDLHHESLLIDRHWNQARSCGEQSAPRAKVAGILQPGCLPWIEQGAHGQVKRTLGASGHDNVLGGAAHSACDADVCSNGLPQREVSGRRLVVSEFTQRLSCAAREQPRPDLVRKQIKPWLATRKSPASLPLWPRWPRDVLERAQA